MPGNNRGVSLLEAMIGACLGTLGLLAFVQLAGGREASLLATQDKQNMENARRFIRVFFDCDATMKPSAPAACATGGPVETKQVDGTILIPETGTIMNGFPIRSTCTGQTIHFEINATPRAATSTWKDLFNGIPVVCPDFNPPPPPPPPPGCIAVNQFFLRKRDNAHLPCVQVRDKEKTMRERGKLGYYRAYLLQRQELCTIPGSDFRDGGVKNDPPPKGTYYLSIEMDIPVEQIRIEPTYVEYHHQGGKVFTTLPTVTLKASQYQAPPDDSGLDVYEIPYPKFIDPNNWKNGGGINSEAQFVITPLDAQGNTIGEVCRYRVALGSPLVLDFGGTPRTLSLGESFVRFDLDADGTQEQTGWIIPPLAFLVLDLNRNGSIDTGRELFGEHTRLKDGQLAANSYEALAQYDESSNGSIDPQDPVFYKLLVWTDANHNAISEPSELETLQSRRITKLGLTPETLTPTQDNALFDNQIRYRSRFWGPKSCGSKGCYSYDVYFRISKDIARARLQRP